MLFLSFPRQQDVRLGLASQRGTAAKPKSVISAVRSPLQPVAAQTEM